jgi:hypothetical protein
MNIPRVGERLEAFYVCQTFRTKVLHNGHSGDLASVFFFLFAHCDQVNTVKESIENISCALQEVKNSKRFKRTLEV